MQKHRVRRNLHVIARMLHSITRRTLENKIGGDWFIIEELPDRRSNGQFVTYKEYSKVVPERLDCFCKELGGQEFTGKTWTVVYKAMETYALWLKSQQTQT